MTLVKADRLLEPPTGNVLAPVAVIIDGGPIKQVGPPSQVQAAVSPGTTLVDLGSATLSCQYGEGRLQGGGIMQATRTGGTLLVVTMLVAGTGIGLSARRPSLKQDRIGIERLHQQDKEATLSDSADQLAKLWDRDGVRFPAGRPAEIGAAVIFADDKQWEMSSGRERSLCYDLEIQDIQIAGDWAFEWGYGSYKIARGDKETVQYAKLMRVMRRQSDGTWRFARVMGLPAPSASAVVLKHPCQ